MTDREPRTPDDLRKRIAELAEARGMTPGAQAKMDQVLKSASDATDALDKLTLAAGALALAGHVEEAIDNMTVTHRMLDQADRRTLRAVINELLVRLHRQYSFRYGNPIEAIRAIYKESVDDLPTLSQEAASPVPGSDQGPDVVRLPTQDGHSDQGEGQ